MTIANADDSRLAYIAEVTAGTTPATPTMQVLGFTSENLQVSPRTLEDDTISGSPDVQDLGRTGIDVGGPIAFNLRDTVGEDLLANVLRGTWSTDALVNGTTDGTFTFEVTREAASSQYKRILGGQVGQLSMDMRIEQPIRCSATILGRSGQLTSTAITGVSYTAAPSERLFDVVSDFGTLAITGMSSPIVTGLQLNFDNNPRPQRQLGNSGNLAGIGFGKTRITGSIEFYLDENQGTALSDALAGTATDFSLGVGSVTGKKYTIEIPNIKWGAISDPIQGQNTDVVVTMPFTGLADSSTLSGQTIRWTRNVA